MIFRVVSTCYGMEPQRVDEIVHQKCLFKKHAELLIGTLHWINIDLFFIC